MWRYRTSRVCSIISLKGLVRNAMQCILRRAIEKCNFQPSPPPTTAMAGTPSGEIKSSRLDGSSGCAVSRDAARQEGTRVGDLRSDTHVTA